MDVECPAHADAVRHRIGMFEREIHRVIRPEAAPGHRELLRRILPADKRHKLMQNVALVLQVPHHPHFRMNVLVVPALGIDAVRAKHLQFAALDLRRQYADHPAVFIFEKLSHRSWKHQQGHSRVPEHQRVHVAVQFLAISFVKFAIHFPSAELDEISYLNRGPLAGIEGDG